MSEDDAIAKAKASTEPATISYVATLLEAMTDGLAALVKELRADLNETRALARAEQVAAEEKHAGLERRISRHADHLNSLQTRLLKLEHDK